MRSSHAAGSNNNPVVAATFSNSGNLVTVNALRSNSVHRSHDTKRSRAATAAKSSKQPVGRQWRRLTDLSKHGHRRRQQPAVTRGAPEGGVTMLGNAAGAVVAGGGVDIVFAAEDQKPVGRHR